MKKIIFFITIMSIVLLSCQSNNKPNPQNTKDSLALPENLFMKNSEVNVFMGNKDMIKTYAKKFEIRPLIIVDFISEVYLSSRKDDFVMTLIAKKISYKRKLDIMKLIKAEPMNNTNRFWKYIDTDNEQVLYIDIGYEEAMIISNMALSENEDLFGWDMPPLFQNAQYTDVDAWVWSTAKDYFDDMGLLGISINWVTLFIVQYEKDKDSEVTIALQYDANKSSRTTVKLFAPLIIQSFGIISQNTNVPEFELEGDVFLLKKLLLNKATLEKYMR